MPASSLRIQILEPLFRPVAWADDGASYSPGRLQEYVLRRRTEEGMGRANKSRSRSRRQGHVQTALSTGFPRDRWQQSGVVGSEGISTHICPQRFCLLSESLGLVTGMDARVACDSWWRTRIRNAPPPPPLPLLYHPLPGPSLSQIGEGARVVDHQLGSEISEM